MAAPGEAPTISVVVATYQRAELLAGLLEDLQRQDAARDRYEVIVVDNGSTDGTAAVVARASHVRHVLEPRRGVSHARNRGVRVARGTWVGFTDDDCRVPPSWIATALRLVDDVGADVFGGPYRARHATSAPAWFRDEWASGGHARPRGWLATGDTLSGGNLFVRRALIEQVGGFDVALGPVGDAMAYGEDSVLQLRLFGLGVRAWNEPDLRVEQVVRPEKYSLVWLLRDAFRRGRDQSRQHGHHGNAAAAAAAAKAAARLAAAAAATVSTPWRDRRSHPFWQQHVFERAQPHVTVAGMHWGCVPRRRARAGGRG